MLREWYAWSASRISDIVNVRRPLLPYVMKRLKASRNPAAGPILDWWDRDPFARDVNAAYYRSRAWFRYTSQDDYIHGVPTAMYLRAYNNNLADADVSWLAFIPATDNRWTYQAYCSMISEIGIRAAKRQRQMLQRAIDLLDIRELA